MTMLPGCDGGPSTSGTFDFSARLDGVPWIADTGIALAAAAPAETTLTITAVRRVSPQEEQDITLSLKNLGSGPFALGGITGPAVGALTVMQLAGDSVTGVTNFLSDSLTPGMLSITSLRRSDSLVAGSFAFEASTLPDMPPHHQITGHFRVRYTLQTVIVP
jgi:hypothetical protein